jgi:4-amino-4-deoxy-L-arabinose transferase-like glycosyltransferase
MPKNKHLKPILILILLSYLFLMLGNGILSLTNPDEVFYGLTAKEMSQQHTWMTPYIFGQPQFEKPIFLYWLLRIAFIIFGISSFSARFFPALFAILGVLAVYFLGLAGLKDERKAFLSGLILMSCGLYIGLARTLFTDMIFSIFILLSLVSFYWGYAVRDKKASGLLLFFIFCGLAVLTKGPLGFLIPASAVILFLLLRKEIRFLFSKYCLWGIFIFALIGLPWYIFMIHKYGHSFTHEFFYNDHIRRILEAEHAGNDKWYFYPFSIIGCIFPWSLFAAAAIFSLPKYLIRRKDPFLLFLACWIGATFLIFQFAHSKLVSYIFPVFPAVALLSADFILHIFSTNSRSRILYAIALANLYILVLIPLGLTVVLAKYPSLISRYIPSRFVINCLAIAFVALLAFMLHLRRQDKLLKCVYALVLVMPIFLFTFPFIHENLEPYLSSKNTCEYLLKNYTVNGVIISSKFFARGIRYYTGKDIAVIDIPGSPYFSPHPIPFLNFDERIRAFLLAQAQDITYCIVKKSYMDDDFPRICANEFKHEFLKQIGNEYIVKVERITHAK